MKRWKVRIAEWTVAGLALAGLATVTPMRGFAGETARPASASAAPGAAAGGPALSPSAPAQPAPTEPPLSDEDRANDLSDQVGKLMVKCVNLLDADDPAALGYCKQQRDLAEQYPQGTRAIDRMLAHDEYGIALAAFSYDKEALAEFDEEVALLPKASKPGDVEWTTAYWHRAMINSQLGNTSQADHDYQLAEQSSRKRQQQQGEQHPDAKMKQILRQHAALLKKQGETAASQKLLAEAAQ